MNTYRITSTTLSFLLIYSVWVWGKRKIDFRVMAWSIFQILIFKFRIINKYNYLGTTITGGGWCTGITRGGGGSGRGAGGGGAGAPPHILAHPS